MADYYSKYGKVHKPLSHFIIQPTNIAISFMMIRRKSKRKVLETAKSSKEKQTTSQNYDRFVKKMGASYYSEEEYSQFVDGIIKFDIRSADILGIWNYLSISVIKYLFYQKSVSDVQSQIKMMKDYLLHKIIQLILFLFSDPERTKYIYSRINNIILKYDLTTFTFPDPIYRHRRIVYIMNQRLRSLGLIKEKSILKRAKDILELIG
jgi:hypothetical protein